MYTDFESLFHRRERETVIAEQLKEMKELLKRVDELLDDKTAIVEDFDEMLAKVECTEVSWNHTKSSTNVYQKTLE